MIYLFICFYLFLMIYLLQPGHKPFQPSLILTETLRNVYTFPSFSNTVLCTVYMKVQCACMLVQCTWHYNVHDRTLYVTVQSTLQNSIHDMYMTVQCTWHNTGSVYDSRMYMTIQCTFTTLQYNFVQHTV